MKNVQIEGGEAELILNKKFYDKKAISKSMGAFSKNFEVEMCEGDEKFTIKIHNERDVNTADVAYQFLNYTLSQMKDNDRVI